MKKFLIGGIIATLLLLDWAALDDITTGNEPSKTSEYLTLFFSIVIFVILITYWVKHKNKKWKREK